MRIPTIQLRGYIVGAYKQYHDRLKWKILFFHVILGYVTIKPILQPFEDVFFWAIILTPIILIIFTVVLVGLRGIVRYIRRVLEKRKF